MLEFLTKKYLCNLSKYIRNFLVMIRKYLGNKRNLFFLMNISNTIYSEIFIYFNSIWMLRKPFKFHKNMSAVRVNVLFKNMNVNAIIVRLWRTFFPNTASGHTNIDLYIIIKLFVHSTLLWPPPAFQTSLINMIVVKGKKKKQWHTVWPDRHSARSKV